MIDVYTDGSYSKAKSDTTYGGFVVLSNAGVPVIVGHCRTTNPEFVSAANVGGELLAAIYGIGFAMAVATQSGDSTARVLHDYTGVYEFVKNERPWLPKKRSSAIYAEGVEMAKKKYPDVNLTFKKVKAHSGVKWNEAADAIANGIIPSDCREAVYYEFTY